MDCPEPEKEGAHHACILRITKEEWLQQVFGLRMYYTGLKRRWKPGMMILFARKSDKGDSFIGYGIVHTIKKVDEFTENEKRESQEFGWTRRIDFGKMLKFEPPLALKNTSLADITQKGKFLHGYCLNEAEARAIIDNAEATIES